MVSSKQSYLICSPKIDQAFVIARYLRKYKPALELIGVSMPGEVRPERLAGFDKIISYEDLPAQLIDQAIIPTGAISTKFLLEKYGGITIGKVTLTVAALRVFNKSWLLNHAKRLGIATPKTWENCADVNSFPVFYKTRYEAGGGLRGIANFPNEIPTESQSKLLFQEVIASSGTYGVSFLAANGVILISHVHYEVESVPNLGGSAVVVEECNDERLIKSTKRLVASLDYSGWGLAEFKYSSIVDDYVLMEINAKFWASCEFSFRNESGFLRYLFNINSGKKKSRRMLFLDRAFVRGMPYVIRNVRFLFYRTSIRIYPGWHRKLLTSLFFSKKTVTHQSKAVNANLT